MSVEFTPGPWSFVESDDPYPCVRIVGVSSAPVLSDDGFTQLVSGEYDCDEEPYGDIEIAELDMTDEPIDERAANVNLICAAPLLYEALDLLLQESKRVNWASKFNFDVGLLEIAQTALLKARGES
jgi:hypothetical protein